MKKKNYTSIQLLLIVLPLVFVSLTAYAEDYYRIWTQNEGIVQKAGSEIDSVKVEGGNINFYTETAVAYTNALANLDSITVADKIYAGNPFSKVGWVATTNSNDTEWGAGAGAGAVIDGNREGNSYWCSAMGHPAETPYWVKIDMITPKTVRSIVIDERYQTCKFEVFTSVDDVEWTSAGTLLFEPAEHVIETIAFLNPVTARYIRVDVVENTEYNDGRGQIWEIDVTGDDSGSSSLVQFDKSTWEASANSNDTQWGLGSGPSAVIDDNHGGNSYWHNAISNEVTEPIWLKVDMKSVKTVSSIIFDMRYNIVTFTVYVSSDDVSYMPIGDFTAGAEALANQISTLQLETPVPARYIKVVPITKSVTYNDWRCGIWEIDVVGIE